ncbi:MAG: pyrrolo-quinoline quinone [Opitutus sp.]|nr:pyrrolo-quinoline quinone [Opitutus sp.]
MGAGAGWQRNRWQRNKSADLSFPCHPFLCQKSPTTAKFAMVTAIAVRKKLKRHSALRPEKGETPNNRGVKPLPQSNLQSNRRPAVAPLRRATPEVRRETRPIRRSRLPVPIRVPWLRCDPRCVVHDPKSIPMLKSPSLAMLLLVACSATAAESSTPNWPQFRGENGTGVAADARPPVKIGPTEGVLWSVEVPWSPSSPSVWADRIFLTTFHDGQLETRCHDRTTGRLLWARGIKSENTEEFHRQDGSPAASTPATDGRHVVSYFGSFGLICHDVDGNELWRHPLPLAQSGGKFGSGTSPIIVHQHVLLNRDQYQFSSLLAVDLKTGKKVWETDRRDAAGSFGTPALWRNNETEEIVLAGTARLKGYDLKTGAERWTIDGVAGMVCTTAVTGDGALYFAAWSPGQADSPRQPWDVFLKTNDKNGDGVVSFDEIDVSRRDYLRGLDRNRDGKFTKEDWDLLKAGDARAENVLIAVKPGGLGDISATHVAWKYRKALPYVPSPLFYDGRLYFVKDGGLLSSLDPKTGEAFYAQERIGANGNYYASPVAADGRIYLASLTGKLTVVRAGGTKPEVLHQSDFATRILATPVLIGDKLYLRTATHLWAFGK